MLAGRWERNGNIVSKLGPRFSGGGWRTASRWSVLSRWLVVPCCHIWNGAGGIMFSAWGCPFVHLSICPSSWIRYFMNHLAEFQQSYRLDALGDNNEWIRFWAQSSVSRQTKYGQKFTFGAIFGPQMMIDWIDLGLLLMVDNFKKFGQSLLQG